MKAGRAQGGVSDSFQITGTTGKPQTESRQDDTNKGSKSLLTAMQELHPAHVILSAVLLQENPAFYKKNQYIFNTLIEIATYKIRDSNVSYYSVIRVSARPRRVTQTRAGRDRVKGCA